MKDVAILCEVCSENGDFGTMWPGGDHDDAPDWGVAEIETDDSGEWVITWLETGLTVAQAEERLDGMDFGGPRPRHGVARDSTCPVPGSGPGIVRPWYRTHKHLTTAIPT